jgi:hypothetical protein
MQEESSQPSRDFRLEPERMPVGEFLIQVLNGIGVAMGLAVLWLMEIFRDRYFRILDRLNVKPRRHRKASAFPPGRPRRQPPASA